MPRGAKKDVAVTRILRANGYFLDRRSFVSLNGTDPHLFLFGEDIAFQRKLVINRAGKKGNGFHCAICKKRLESEYEAEMDHIKGGLVGRCDCLHNLRILCKPCHRAKHVHTRFGETT